MKRKLVKQGAATLMVSLPAKWLKRLGLGKGDEINVDEADESLVLSKEGVKGRRETEINLTKQTRTGARTLLTNAYRSGYDTVKIRYSDEAHLNDIMHAIRNYLLGYDITKKEKGYCVVENITEPSAGQFEALMHKIFFNIKELIEITGQRLQGKKALTDYKETVQRIHQYDSFCRRVVAKKLKEMKDPNLFWAMQTLIVHGQRDLYHLNRFLDKNPARASKETLSLLDDLAGTFNTLISGYLKKDTALLEEVHDMENSFVYRKGYSLLSRKKGKECIVIHHIMDSIRNFYLASSPMMGILLRGQPRLT